MFRTKFSALYRTYLQTRIDIIMPNYVNKLDMFITLIRLLSVYIKVFCKTL